MRVGSDKSNKKSIRNKSNTNSSNKNNKNETDTGTTATQIQRDESKKTKRAGMEKRQRDTQIDKARRETESRKRAYLQKVSL